MPLYIVYAKDKADNLQQRLDQYAAHRAYVEAQGEIGRVSVVLSGPLQTDDGTIMIGSMILLNAPDREAVMQFVAENPFNKAGVWESVSVTRFHARHAPSANLKAINPAY